MSPVFTRIRLTLVLLFVVYHITVQLSMRNFIMRGIHRYFPCCDATAATVIQPVCSLRPKEGHLHTV